MATCPKVGWLPAPRVLLFVYKHHKDYMSLGEGGKTVYCTKEKKRVAHVERGGEQW